MLNEVFEKRIIQYFKVIIVLYSFVALYYFLSPSPSGDEFLFIEDLELIRVQGWIEAIAKSISIPYMILSYPFSFFLSNFTALRVVNIILLLLFLIYVKSQYKDNRSLVLYYLLFFFSTVGVCYSGTNDWLFFLTKHIRHLKIKNQILILL